MARIQYRVKNTEETQCNLYDGCCHHVTILILTQKKNWLLNRTKFNLRNVEHIHGTMIKAMAAYNYLAIQIKATILPTINRCLK